ncbi:hypothetical protein D3C73_1619910 [compost metagenome]
MSIAHIGMKRRRRLKGDSGPLACSHSKNGWRAVCSLRRSRTRCTSALQPETSGSRCAADAGLGRIGGSEVRVRWGTIPRST